MSYESKKNAHLQCHLVACFISLNELFKLTRMMSIFTSKTVWKLLIKIQWTKSDPKKYKGGNCPPSCQLGIKDTSRHTSNESLGQQMAKYIEDSGVFLGYLINLVLQNNILLIKSIFSKHMKISLANFEVFLPLPTFLN